MWGRRTQVYIQDAQKIVDSRWASVVNTAASYLGPPPPTRDNDSSSEDEDADAPRMDTFGQREESSGDESAPDDPMEESDLEYENIVAHYSSFPVYIVLGLPTSHPPDPHHAMLLIDTQAIHKTTRLRLS
ncbi:hypothetical protein EUX98_g7654 [Antrodiella citrinella]|uniref:Uncharacterized protein n=1 Tax=Antrodiella citrinella TaxID=2447956 RepID=A0A4S4MMV9_9APHY|nr:hypothetical protein EUX98_g7654 [Antrodiella citrinella]